MDKFIAFVTLIAVCVFIFLAQTAINVTNALKSIVQDTNTYPKMIQADNGSEFMNETSDWMKENNIVYIKTLSYTPTSNGLVEGKNRRIR